MTPRELESYSLDLLKVEFPEEREQVLRNEITAMLCSAMQISKEKLVILKNNLLSDNKKNKFISYIERRIKKEPLAYILGEQEFFSLNFKVTSDVLIPRPETELLVQEAIKISDQFKYAVDIGSGSGAIIVSLLKNAKHLKAYALDLSLKACQITKENSVRHEVSIEVLHSNLLEKLPEIKEPILFLSNPPYIPEAEKLMPDVQNYEPKLALRAGEDGLDVIKLLLKQIAQQVLKNPQNILFLEIGANQHNDVEYLAQELNLEILETYRDFQRIIRIIKIGKK